MQNYKQAEPASIRDIDLSPSVSFARIRKYDQDLAFTFLTKIVNELADFFSVGKNMGAKQIEETVKLLLKEYYFLKPEDYKLCFLNAKKGLYGQLFDRLDGQVICGWLNLYCEERANYFEQKSIGQHNSVVSKPTPIHPEAAKLYADIRKELETNVSKECEYKKFKEDYLSKSVTTNDNPDNQNKP